MPTTRDKKASDGKAPKRPVGRPAFEPTADQRLMVKTLAGFGVPQDGICQAIKNKGGAPINKETLLKYFREELDQGVHEANAKVAGSLFKNAVGNENVAAQIFWLKTRAGWRETPQQIAFTDPDGNPAEPPSLGDFYASVHLAALTAAPAAPEGGDKPA